MSLIFHSRYSREVGSTQVHLDVIPTSPSSSPGGTVTSKGRCSNNNSSSNRLLTSSPPPSFGQFANLQGSGSNTNNREKCDLRGRYQPDPTFKPPVGVPAAGEADFGCVGGRRSVAVARKARSSPRSASSGARNTSS